MHSFQQPNAPLLLWNQNQPLFVPFIGGLPPQVQELVPYMATVLANEFITKAETNPARMFTFNQMSNCGWNNAEFASAVEILAAGSIAYIQRGIVPTVPVAINTLTAQIANWITSKNALVYLVQYNVLDQQTIAAAQNLAYEFDQFLMMIGGTAPAPQVPMYGPQQGIPNMPMGNYGGVGQRAMPTAPVGGYPGMSNMNNRGGPQFSNQPRGAVNKWTQQAPTQPGPFVPKTTAAENTQANMPVIKRFAEKASHIFSSPSIPEISKPEINKEINVKQKQIQFEEYEDSAMDREQHRLFGIPLDTENTKGHISGTAIAYGYLTKAIAEDPRGPDSLVTELRQLELKEYQMTNDIVTTSVIDAIRIGEYHLIAATEKKPYIYITKARVLRPIVCGGDFTAKLLAIVNSKYEPIAMTMEKFFGAIRDLIRNDSKNPAELSLITQIDLILAKEVNHILHDILGLKDISIDSFLEDLVYLKDVVLADHGDVYLEALNNSLELLARQLSYGFSRYGTFYTDPSHGGYNDLYKQLVAEILTPEEIKVTTIFPMNYDIIHVDLFAREINIQNKAKLIGFNSNWLRDIFDKVVLARLGDMYAKEIPENVLIVTKDQKIFQVVSDSFTKQSWLLVNYDL